MESLENVLFIYLGVLMFLSFQVTDVSSATDTISADQQILRTDTIVSSSKNFILGFNYPVSGLGSGNSGFFIGIWYRESPQTIVWVANQENYVVQGIPSSDCYLTISNGNLILYDFTSAKTIWSTDVKSSRSKDVRAVLLDDGNLVLKDGPNSSAVVLWQSFDHPADTWLPGAKLKLGSPLLTSWNTLTGLLKVRYTLELDPSTNNSLIIVWNMSKTYWSSGPWDGRLKSFKGLPHTGVKLSFELNLDKSYITYSSDAEFTYHLLMDVSGRLQLRLMSYSHDTGMVQWSQPANRCTVYRYCGSFGICNEKEELLPCRCVPGFTQAIDLGSGSTKLFSGCIRKNELQCGKGYDSFRPIENIKLATDPSWVSRLVLRITCASACLTDCSCNAYAYDDNDNCLMWTKDVFNLQQLQSKGHTFFLRVAASNITTGPGPSNITTTPSNQKKKKHSKRRSLVLPVVLSSGLLATAVFLLGLYRCVSSRKRSKRRHKEEKQRRNILGGIIDDDGENMCYLNLHDIMAATNAFSQKNKLGEGGFGPVYKGKLLNGMDVAIKRLSKKSSQGLTEFKNEVVLIIRLQHKNLVRLLGYCVENDEKLLIYEYLSNKSLDALLFDSLKCRELDWETRMKIINGTTRGLQYLHEYSRLRIIHRDLKASNILLDDEMNPKISDFGTARIFGCNQVDDNTQRIVGTYGYMSPEYALGGIISEKSDIYSFGVLLLEIISGKKATRFMHNDQKHSLVSHAWESWCETKGVSIVDEALCGSYSLKEVMRCVQIALLCVQDHPNDRPTISQIVYMLSNDYNLPIPKQPTFSTVLNDNQQLVSSDCVFSINEVTQIEMEAR